ncbi:TnsA endonuclease N-terminal domain-containing protein [Halomonas urmiana]|uniref:TnsA endonuclease N-terminal domain-containing protein n=1 Tax=Halomonas urmiana TaxID=490901 RepID=UPI001305424E|nr:TnsA endonuclease N-terminal domain-containing protein [Halomonas urmiana]
MLTVESSLEFDACFHFEYTSTISSYEAQPEGFYYFWGEKQLPYTPDFLVVDKDRGSRFIEVKPYTELENEEFRDKFSCRQRSALEHGVPLLLVTEKQIRVNPILSNLKLLHRYSGLKTLTPLHLMLLDIVRKSGKVRVRDLVHETGESSSTVLSSVISWLAIGEISSDLSAAKLGIDSIVW